MSDLDRLQEEPEEIAMCRDAVLAVRKDADRLKELASHWKPGMRDPYHREDLVNTVDKP